MDPESKDRSTNLGKTNYQFFFVRCCSLELTIPAGKETTQRKEIKEESKKQANANHVKQRTHQQRQLTKRKHLLDYSRFYGVVVSTLDSESKDPSSTLGRTLLKFFFDHVDDSDNIGSEENQSAKKKDSRKKTLNKQKLVSTTELTSKGNSHNVSFSYIRAASMIR